MTRRCSIYSIGHPSVGTFKDRPDKISLKEFGQFLLTLVFAMGICAEIGKETIGSKLVIQFYCFYLKKWTKNQNFWQVVLSQRIKKQSFRFTDPNQWIKNQLFWIIDSKQWIKKPFFQSLIRIKQSRNTFFISCFESWIKNQLILCFFANLCL